MAENEKLREIAVVGADGVTWRFRSWRQFEAWLVAALEGWAFLRNQTGPDPANLAHYVAAQLNAAVEEARQHRDAMTSLSEISGVYDRHLRGTYGPPHPASERGRQILEIRAVAGDQAARFAFGLLMGVVSPSNAQAHEDWRGMSLALNPEILAMSGHTSRLTTERANYRAGLRKLTDDIDARERERHREWGESLSSAGQAAVDWHASMTRRWLKAASKIRKRERAAMDKLRATDIAFTEKMALKAPVEYWEKKAAKHKVAEEKMRGWLRLYFPLGFLLLVAMFGGVGYYLLTTPKTSLPPGLTVVASAGLATAAGMLFWLGRLLTKLYLSQHHLRQDAEERATMTTTYLALTEVSAPGDADRQIVLNALFRNTSDGIVKEEGGFDPNVAAVLGRLLAR
ncbi:MAG: hypothetical protein IE910_00775 [Brevundimonas sp.]|nr:hypothetical protein [Brevundimonas sp.]